MTKWNRSVCDFFAHQTRDIITMSSSSRKKKPYSERTDREKVESNWRKTQGLFSREEYSLAIVRAATTIELAVNFAIRQEFAPSKLPAKFIDHLVWANGLNGKYRKLLLPMVKGSPRHTRFKNLEADLMLVNRQRNWIVHSGQFKKKETAEEILVSAKKLIETLVSEYEKIFSLPK